jgi:hypothetical protein
MLWGKMSGGASYLPRARASFFFNLYGRMTPEEALEHEELKALCARAAEALEEEFGTLAEPAYGIKGPIHELISELRKAAGGGPSGA